MRSILLAGLILAAPAAAAAQHDFDPYWMAREAELRTQQELMRQRQVALQNELTALEMRQQTEQSLRVLEQQRQRPYIHIPLDRRPSGAAAPADIGAFAEFPQDRLNESNARVRAANPPRR